MNPALPELVLPGDPHVETDVLVARATTPLQLRVLPDHVVGEPRRDVAPEALVVTRQLDVGHDGHTGRAMSSTRTPSGSARKRRSMPGLARVSSMTVAPQSTRCRVAASRSST